MPRVVTLLAAALMYVFTPPYRFVMAVYGDRVSAALSAGSSLLLAAWLNLSVMLRMTAPKAADTAREFALTHKELVIIVLLAGLLIVLTTVGSPTRLEKVMRRFDSEYRFAFPASLVLFAIAVIGPWITLFWLD